MQLSIFILLTGLGIATASWVFLLLAVMFMIMPLSWLKTEEHYLLNFYRDAYREYIKRTPRWIGIPKA
jgi:protein-S-isoprenylcysteine O-methyltransferase Ste14